MRLEEQLEVIGSSHKQSGFAWHCTIAGNSQIYLHLVGRYFPITGALENSKMEAVLVSFKQEHLVGSFGGNLATKINLDGFQDCHCGQVSTSFANSPFAVLLGLKQGGSG